MRKEVSGLCARMGINLSCKIVGEKNIDYNKGMFNKKFLYSNFESKE